MSATSSIAAAGRRGSPSSGWRSDRKSALSQRRLVALAMTTALMAPLVGIGGANASVKPDGLVSRSSDGQPGNQLSYQSDISADGRLVVFSSNASNLVAGDTNGSADIFLRNRQTGVTTMLSRHSDGSNANGVNYEPSISADGRYVAFSSYASNLVDDDTNGMGDVFLHDVSAATTERISVRSNGDEGNSTSLEASINSDGSLVTFRSGASNLVPNDTNSSVDVFVHAPADGSTRRVSVDSNGIEADSNSFAARISADGSAVAFSSVATNLVANDTNGARDVFVHEMESGTTLRASVRTDGTQVAGDSDLPDISGNGNVVSFLSGSDALVDGDTNPGPDVFIRRIDTATTDRVSDAAAGSPLPNAPNLWASISDDGRHIVWSRLNGLLPNEGGAAGVSQVYLRNIVSGATQLMSTGPNGPGDLPSQAFAGRGLGITANGSAVSFGSVATNLVSGDTNGTIDVYVATAQRCGGKLANVVVGQFGAPTGGDDVILGTSGNDTINGLAGNDTVCGLGGNDTLIGGNGNDALFGGVGADEITGGPGNDNLRGGPGNDKLFGREGNDKVRGGSDRDIVSGHGGDDLVDGGFGADIVNGGNGADLVVGGQGNDIVRGHGGNDRIDGGAGFDRLVGGNGNDVLLGRKGNDTLIGGNGNDAHHGGPNIDSCIPGAGADTKTSCEK